MKFDRHDLHVGERRPGEPRTAEDGVHGGADGGDRGVDRTPIEEVGVDRLLHRGRHRLHVERDHLGTEVGEDRRRLLAHAARGARDDHPRPLVPQHVVHAGASCLVRPAGGRR